ncbi:MAG: GHKL domain-containing protein [Clostridiales bacterium]|nr:GHKL domain-containing protein [Clostridiales bacterium]
MRLFEFSLNLIDAVMIMSFITLYFGSKYKGVKKLLGYAAGVAADLGLTVFFDHVFVYESLFALSFMLLYFIYALIFLKGDIYSKIFIAGITDCVIYAVGTVLLLATSAISGLTYEEITEFSTVRVIFCAADKVVLLAVYAILLKFKIKNISPGKSAVVFVMLPLASEMCLNEITNVFVAHTDLRNDLLVTLGSVVMIMILTYYMIINMSRSEQLKSENAALRQKLYSDSEHAREITVMYTKLCALRHDLESYFRNAVTYMREDPVKAEEYMQSLVENELAVKDIFINTGNKCLDSLINSKVSACVERGIHVELKIMRNALYKFTDDELGVIFGNLFDNAIRASKDSKKKIIKVLADRQDDIVSILMLNSIDEPVLKSNCELETTKPDKDHHGYGIKNIRSIVKKHNGVINLFEEDGYFGFHIWI